MEKISILWADDEIDLLKPHIIFLNEKGYDVKVATNGNDALDLLFSQHFDIVFLDENMPGMSGLETLMQIKSHYPYLPVVMITKSEEESIMNDAIGSNISDYLIKPVNPNQILLSLKKNLETKKLVSEKTTTSYQQEFRNIANMLNNKLTYKDWIILYKKLTHWELELEKSSDNSLMEIIKMQKTEANILFGKFIENNYLQWLQANNSEKPTLSHLLVKNKILPLIENKTSTALFIIDNLRYDQWKVLQPIIENYYRTEVDDIYYSILPTATQFARNALFAGLLPSEIEKKYPKYWLNEDDEGHKNQFENELLSELLKRNGIDIKYSYNKILNLNVGKRIVETLPNLLHNNLNVIVYNFIDMLSHARTDMDVVRELAEEEPAYRSLTVSWFQHSPLFEMIKFFAEKKIKIIISTDHGSIRVNNAIKVIGDKNISTNLRYKQGKNLQYNKKEVFEVKNPSDIFLPKANVSTTYIFARNNDFFAYPNNFNHYVSYYKNTFQHGGISMEEMLIPFVVMTPK